VKDLGDFMPHPGIFGTSGEVSSSSPMSPRRVMLRERSH
jgi:hypothetical protein